MASPKSRDEIWTQWNERVNMAPAELERWLKTSDSKAVGDADGTESTGHKSGRRIVEIKRTRKAQLSDDQWEHMATVVGYIARHCAQGGPKHDVESSPWRYALMNWGHDPLKDDGCCT